MKRLFIFKILLLLIACTGNLYSQSLKILYGYRLLYYDAKRVQTIKEIGVGESYQGYDLIDSTSVFIAYDPRTSTEPASILSVYDLENKTEYLSREIYGTGETSFHYNKNSGLVAFNWMAKSIEPSFGIYVTKIDLSIIRKEKNIKFQPKLLFRCEQECISPIWISDNTISYQIWENNKSIVKFYTIDEH